MAHQRFAYAGAVDHVEHPGWHASSLGGPLDRLGDILGSGHVATVGLDHHRATGSQRGSGIAACRGERQREVAGAEYRHRADTGAVLA